MAGLFLIPLPVGLGRDARVRHVLAELDPGQLRGDGEGAVDPAVRVHHAAGHAVHHALQSEGSILTSALPSKEPPHHITGRTKKISSNMID